MQPIIGITMCIDENKLIKRNANHNYVREEYSQAVRGAGGQPIFLDPSIDPLVAAKICDGIVISGGEDIDPALYGQTATTAHEQSPRRRSDWERLLIDACDEWDRPILGICYGSQLLNVHYGGTLYQDIAMEYPQAISHGTDAQAAYHEVTFTSDFLGYRAGERVTVAARHHQAVHQLAPGFVATAHSADGVVEAISGNGHVGVQWHAECDEMAAQIYGQFIECCRRRMQQTLPVQKAGRRHVQRLGRFLTRFR